MKKTILFLVMIFCLQQLTALHLTPAETAWLEDHPVIRIAPDPQFPPIEWFDENDEYRGIAAEFMDLISQQLEIEFEVVRCNNWNEVLSKAQNREVDMLPAAAQTPDRAEYMLFSRPHLVFPGVIITTERNRELKDSQKLYNRKVGIVSDYVWQEFIKHDHPQVEIVEVENVIDGLRKVSTDEIDALIATLPIALYYIEQEGIHNLVVAGQTEYETKLSILTRNDWPHLHSIINKALNNISEEKKKEIIQKWITLKPVPLFSRKIFWIVTFSILIGVALIVLLSFLWNFSLKKQVKLKTRELEEDIVRRKKAEEDLAASEEKFRSLIESSNDGICLQDMQGKIIFANKRKLQILGYDNEKQLLGSNVFDLLKGTEKQRFKEMIPILIEKGFLTNIETEVVKRDGSTLAVDLNFKLISDENCNPKFIMDTMRDITQRKEYEKEITASEKTMRALVAGTKAMFFSTDLRGRFTYLNQTIEEFFNVPTSEMIGRFYLRFVHPQDRHWVHQHYQKQIKYKTPSTFIEFRYTGMNNKIGWVSFLVNPLFDHGRFVGLSGVAQDITERKQAENLLVKAEKKYRDLFEKSEDAILIIHNRKFVDCNQATINMLRYHNKDELLNTHPSELSPEKQPDGKMSFTKANEMMEIAIKKGSHRFEWDHKRSDGEVFPVEVLLTAISSDKDNQIIHTVWRDITERKQAEEALKQSEKNYRDIFNNATDAIYIQDRECRFLDVNRGAIEMYGYPKEFFLGKTPEFLSAPGKNDLNKIAGFVKDAFNGISRQYDFWGIKKNGEVFPKIVRSQKGIYLGKAVVVTFAIDITERKKAEETLKKRMKELEIFNDAAVNREIMLNEARKEINELLEKLGKEPKYEIVKQQDLS